MKKTFVYFCVAIFLFLLSTGCSVKNSSYNSYVTDVANDGVLSSAEKSFWNTGRTINSSADFTLMCIFENTEYLGEYRYTMTTQGYSYSEDYYKGDGFEFAVRSDSGELSRINITGKNYYATEPFLEDIATPQETTQRMAQEIAKKYIDLSKYTLESLEPVLYSCEKDGVPGNITTYTYVFIKYIGNIPSSDTVYITINSKGTLKSLILGDIGAFNDIDSKSFSVSSVNENIDTKVTTIYSKSLYTYVAHKIEGQQFCRTPNGEKAIISNIRITLKNVNAEEFQTGVKITTIISAT